MRKSPLAIILPLVLVLAPVPLHSQPAEADVAAILDEAGPGTRWGIVVLDANGAEVLAIDPDGRFMPASNTKLFTTAAALWSLDRGTALAQDSGGASIRLNPTGRAGEADVILTGRGEAQLSGSRDCLTVCLARLADAVAAQTRSVRDVVGDDTAFPDQRWSPGMSWNNIPTRSGTGISALSIDNNEISATVVAGAVGSPPAVTVAPYYSVENHALTVAGSQQDLGFDRIPGSRVLILTGTIGAQGEPALLQLGVDDPAHYAAWQLAGMLRERGVNVTGQIIARHRSAMPADFAGERRTVAEPQPASMPPLARLAPSSLEEGIIHINKVSQNLHAELLLHRLGLLNGAGSIADGQAVVTAMLAEAGVPRNAVSLSDGSGMSTYNRVSPRGMAQMLAWIARQPWGAKMRATLPVGGVDGSLARRFVDTALSGKIAAKTGSINATNALAGYMTANSGQTLVFAIYANDVPDDVRATAIMDRALLAIAASY